MSEEKPALRPEDELDVRISFVKELVSKLDYVVINHRDLSKDNKIFFQNYLLDVAEDLFQITREMKRRSGKELPKDFKDFFEEFEQYRANYLAIVLKLRGMNTP